MYFKILIEDVWFEFVVKIVPTRDETTLNQGASQTLYSAQQKLN